MTADLGVLKDYIRSAGSAPLCKMSRLRTVRDVLRGAGWTDSQIRAWLKKERFE